MLSRKLETYLVVTICCTFIYSVFEISHFWKQWLHWC